MPNDDLHKPLRSINKTIARLREDVQSLVGEVKKIRESITAAAETIRDAIHENIRAQAELKLMEYQMEVRSVKPQIQAEQEQIESEKRELDDQLERIQSRYAEKQAELDEVARERIRDLGSHIFAIEEEEFQEGVEDPLTEKLTATWQDLRAHNDEVRDERTQRIRGRANEVVQSAREFVDRQDELVDSIESYRFEDDAAPTAADAERFQVPYYVVEYEVDGVTQRETILPSRTTADGGTDWCSVELDTVDGAAALIGQSERPSGPTKTDGMFEYEVVSTLSEYGESSLLGNSYGDAVDGAMPESGEIVVEVPEGDR